MKNTGFLTECSDLVCRRQSAWIKLGIVIRIAQDLGFMKEPDKSLSIIVQEERRRVFWTVYMLDRFSVCGADRAPAISDSDCKLFLPCNELAFQQGYAENQETCLERMFDHKPGSDQPNAIALSIIMSSTLGLVARYMLSRNSEAEPVALWDVKSEYAVTSSRLMMFERYFNPGIPFSKIVERDFTCNGVVDHQQMGHVLLSKVLFHLNYILLHHPLLLRYRLACFSSNQVPPSFLNRAIQNCTEHAVAMAVFMQEANAAGCNTTIPYFCYGMGICASVHALNLCATNSNMRKEALVHYEFICDYLRELARLKYANSVVSLNL